MQRKPTFVFKTSTLLAIALFYSISEIGFAAAPKQNPASKSNNKESESKTASNVKSVQSKQTPAATNSNCPLSKTDLQKTGQPTKAGEMFVKGWAALNVEFNALAAAKFFKEGLKIDPGSASCNLGMADIVARTSLKKAVGFLNAALNRDPNYPEALIRSGLRYEHDDMYGIAIKEFSRAIAADSMNLQAYCLRGLAYFDTDDIQHAREDLVVAHKLAPKNPSTLLLKAELEYYDGQYEWVIYNCNRIVVPVANQRGYFLRSKAHMRLFNFHKAKTDLELAETKKGTVDDWYKERLADFEYDHVHAETDPAKRFALACSAPMFEFNNQGFESLPGVEPTLSRRTSKITTLIQSWGIRGKSDLEQTIRTLTNGEMHHPVWMKMWRAYKQNPAQVEKEEHGSTRLALVKQYGEKFGERGSLAFDLGRVVSLCRWGYVCGYLNDDEAFKLMLPAVVRIQNTYKNWDDYLESYFVGRRFWRPSSYTEEPARVERVQHILTMDPNGMKAIPWDTKLVYKPTKPKGWTWPWDTK